MSAPENPNLIFPWLLRGKAMAHLTNHDEAVAWLNQSGRASRSADHAEGQCPGDLDGQIATPLLCMALGASRWPRRLFFTSCSTRGFFENSPMYQRNCVFQLFADRRCQS